MDLLHRIPCLSVDEIVFVILWQVDRVNLSTFLPLFCVVTDLIMSDTSFQCSKRPLEGGQDEQGRPRKKWRGPLPVLFPEAVAEEELETDPYPHRAEGEGLTQPEVRPAEEQERLAEGEGGKEEEIEFWLPGTGRRFPVSKDFDWQSSDLEVEVEELMDYEDWQFSDSELEQVELIDRSDQPPPDPDDDSDIRNIIWIGPQSRRKRRKPTRSS